jgi:hypothetical protein
MIDPALLKAEERKVLCPDCGARMTLRVSKQTKVFTEERSRLFYGCTKFPACMGTVSADETGAPQGVPATIETKKARIRAHMTFDKLWKQPGGRMSRSEAYAWMKERTGIEHIADMNEEQCEDLVAALLVDFDLEAE